MKDEKPMIEEKPVAKPKAPAGPTKAPSGPVVMDEDLGQAMTVEDATEKV